MRTWAVPKFLFSCNFHNYLAKQTYEKVSFVFSITFCRSHTNQANFTWWMPENFEKSSGGMHQSNKSIFSLILDSWTLFGSTLWALWIPHLRATCAGDLLSFSAISTNIGSFKISPFTQDPGDPRGEYACTQPTTYIYGGGVDILRFMIQTIHEYSNDPLKYHIFMLNLFLSSMWII